MQLQILCTNIDSLVPNFSELKVLLYEKDVDVFCICEVCPKNLLTKLDPAYIQIPGYLLLSNLDSNLCQRGVSIYTKLGIKVDKIDFSISQPINAWAEHALVRLLIEFETVNIGVLYHSPSAPNQLVSHQAVSNLIQMFCSLNSSLVLYGDFNMPGGCWFEGIGYSPPNNPSYTTTQTLTGNFLTQIIMQPTRFRHLQQPSLLDLLITNDPERITSTCYLPAFGASDHICIMNNININHSRDDKLKRTFTNHTLIHEELANINWEEELSDETDVDSSWNCLKSTLLGACRKLTNIYWSDKPKTLPYLPRNIKKIIRKKNRAQNKYLKYKCDNHHSKYTMLQNKLRNMTKKVI